MPSRVQCQMAAERWMRQKKRAIKSGKIALEVVNVQGDWFHGEVLSKVVGG